MTSHIMIPDTQVRPGVSTKHLEWANNFIKDKKPDRLILIGDWWDMPSLSSYNTQKEMETLRYREDIEAGMDALSVIMKGVKAPTYMTFGNHEERINTAIDKDPKLEGTISLKDCDVEKHGIKRVPFLKPINLEGINYAHYFYAKGSGRPHSSARIMLNREHRSCTMGHVQTLDYEIAETTNKHFIRALVAGAFYLHDETYKGAAGNNHWRGIIHKENVRAGMYDLREISMHSLRRDYA